jgi:hypothetical protein
MGMAKDIIGKIKKPSDEESQNGVPEVEEEEDQNIIDRFLKDKKKSGKKKLVEVE